MCLVLLVVNTSASDCLERLVPKNDLLCVERDVKLYSAVSLLLYTCTDWGQCFWHTMTAWEQHAVSRSGVLLLLQEDDALKPKGKAAHTTIIVFLTYIGCMIAMCCPQLGTRSSFIALMLLIGWQEGHPACRSSATTTYKSLVLGTGLTWSNSGKMGRLNEKPSVRVR